MNSTVSGPKKPALCRYFLNNGSCYYGDDCQFLHEIPGPGTRVAGQLKHPFGRSTPPYDAVGEHPVTSDANNGDQFFTATFSSDGTIPEFQPFLAPGQRGGKNPRSSPMRSGNETPKFYMSEPPNKLEPQLVNSFDNLSLSRHQDMDTYKVQAKIHMGPPEFAVPKPSSTLSHSASTPSFASYPISSANQIVQHNALSVSARNSPVHSPGLSPTASPRTERRNHSPMNNIDAANPGGTIQENVGGTTYFYTPEVLAQQVQGVMMPSVSVYPGIPAHLAHMKPKPTLASFGASDEVKMELLNRHAYTMMQIDPDQNPDIPQQVDNYEHLFPLEPPPANPLQKSSTFGYPTTCYKAQNTKDGLFYCLRRIHGYRLTSTKCMAVIDMWKKIQHTNIIQLREVFTTKAFNDHSIVFVYDFHAGAETLMHRHFSNHGRLNGFANPFGLDSRGGAGGRHFGGKGKPIFGGRQHQPALLAESLIWNYIVQLTSALRTIHSAGLACRVMDPTKILLRGKSRLWLNCVGIFDVLNFDATSNNALALMPHLQQDDMVALGKVVLALACNSVSALQRENLHASVELVARNYSADLKNLILYLLGNQNRVRSVNDIMPMIGARFYTQLEASQIRNDSLENELAKEVENSRLFRMVCKLGVLNERQEFNMDPSWSETGDRYMLKLFRDFLFHQVDENGTPWIDMAHVIQSLNKLDAGSHEKICLMSRDEQTVLVVSYAELKECYESAFNDILAATCSQMNEMT